MFHIPSYYQMCWYNDDYIDEMNRRNEKENLLNGFVTDVVSRDFVTIDSNNIDKYKEKEKEEEKKVEEMLYRLTETVLDHLVSVSAKTLQPPPPPYKSADKVEMRVAHSVEEIQQTADQTLDYLVKCVRCGLPINSNNMPSGHSIPQYAEERSYLAFVRLIQHQTVELFIQATTHFNLLSVADTPPPWIREQVKPPAPNWLLKHTRHTAPTLSSLKPLVSAEVARLIHVQQYSIEAILSKEVVQGDVLWQDFNKDEVALKFRLADIILTDLLQDTVVKLKDIDCKRNIVLSDKQCVTIATQLPKVQNNVNISQNNVNISPPVRLKRTNSF